MKDALDVRSQLPRNIQGPATSLMCHRKEAMLGSEVYLSPVTSYPLPAKKSKGQGILMGSHPVVQGELELVLVINISIEIGWFSSSYDWLRRLSG